MTDKSKKYFLRTCTHTHTGTQETFSIFTVTSVIPSHFRGAVHCPALGCTTFRLCCGKEMMCSVFFPLLITAYLHKTYRAIRRAYKPIRRSCRPISFTFLTITDRWRIFCPLLMATNILTTKKNVVPACWQKR